MHATVIFDQTRWALWSYYCAYWLHQRGIRRLATALYFLSRWITNIDIHPSVTLGKGVKMPHGFGIVIGQKVRIGHRVTILQQVTIGAAYLQSQGYTEADVPVIEDDVVLGAGSKILGGITIGCQSIIGANAVVIHDIPPGSVVVGVPGRVIKHQALQKQDIRASEFN